MTIRSNYSAITTAQSAALDVGKKRLEDEGITIEVTRWKNGLWVRDLLGMDTTLLIWKGSVVVTDKDKNKSYPASIADAVSSLLETGF